MALDGPFLLTLDDKLYRVSRLDQDLQEQYGEWCAGHYLKIMLHTKGEMSPEDYRLLVLDYQWKKTMQMFDLEPGSISFLMLDSQDAYIHFLWLAIRRHQGLMEPEVKKLVEAHPQEFREVVKQMFASKKNWTATSSGTSCSTATSAETKSSS